MSALLKIVLYMDSLENSSYTKEELRKLLQEFFYITGSRIEDFQQNSYTLIGQIRDDTLIK